MLCTVLGVALLLWLASMGDGSVIGSVLAPRRTHCGWSRTVTICRTEDESLCVGSENDPDAVALVFTWRGTRPRGLLAPTVNRTVCRVDVLVIDPDQTHLSPSFLSIAHALVAEDWEAFENDHEVISLFRSGGGVLERPIPSGYMANLCFIFTFGLWLWTASSIPFAAARLGRGARRAKRLGGGRCGECGYDLKGVPSPTCPECGLAVSVSSIGGSRQGTGV